MAFWDWGYGDDGPQFSPPPVEIQHRLTWRTDDTIDVIEKRLKQVNKNPYQGGERGAMGVLLWLFWWKPLNLED